MQQKPDITKASAILIRDRKVLIVRKKGLDTWISLGGKPEPGETMEDALRREVKEEVGLELSEEPKEYHISPIEPVAGKPELTIIIYTYLISADGEPKLNPEDNVEELHWLSRAEFESGEFELGSVLQQFVVPKLIEDDLI